jgi:hypothetical protein
MKVKTWISNGGYRVGTYLISTGFVIGFLFAKLDHIGMWGPRIFKFIIKTSFIANA